MKFILVLALFAAVLIAGCVDYGTQEPPSAASGEVKEFTISGTEFSFRPPSISVSAGDTVRITFRNSGAIGHNFGIPGLGVRTRTIGPGLTETVEFTAASSGTFDFDCSVPGHKERGMLGRVNIS